MKKNTIALLMSLFIISNHSNASEIKQSKTLTLYNNYSLYEGYQKSTNNSYVIISTPNQIQKQTFNIEPLNKNIKIKNYTYKKNNLVNLLSLNLNKKVTINHYKNYFLKNVYNNFILLKKNQDKVIVNISDIKNFTLPIMTNLDNSYFQIQYSPKIKNIPFQYEYLFAGIHWKTNYILTINEKNNLQLQSFFNIDNNTNKDFKNININFIAGDLHLNNISPRRIFFASNAKFDSVARKTQPSFNSFSGFQEYNYNQKINIKANSSLFIPFKKYKKFPHSLTYEFNNLIPHKIQKETRIQKPDMILTLNRKQNKKYQFPITSGNISIYKAQKNQKVIINQQSIGNYSKNENVKLNLGKAFDVYLTYNFKYLNTNYKKITNKRELVLQNYQLKLIIQNNEPNKVNVEIPIYNKNKVEKHNYTLKPNEKILKSFKITNWANQNINN